MIETRAFYCVHEYVTGQSLVTIKGVAFDTFCYASTSTIEHMIYSSNFLAVRVCYSYVRCDVSVEANSRLLKYEKTKNLEKWIWGTSMGPVKKNTGEFVKNHDSEPNNRVQQNPTILSSFFSQFLPSRPVSVTTEHWQERTNEPTFAVKGSSVFYSSFFSSLLVTPPRGPWSECTVVHSHSEEIHGDRKIDWANGRTTNWSPRESILDEIEQFAVFINLVLVHFPLTYSKPKCSGTIRSYSLLILGVSLEQSCRLKSLIFTKKVGKEP